MVAQRLAVAGALLSTAQWTYTSKNPAPVVKREAEESGPD
jgi:hypothetical protein